MAGALFRPLAGATASALSSASDAPGSAAPAADRADCLEEDSTFAPPPPRFGADDAALAARVAPDSDSDGEEGGGGRWAARDAAAVDEIGEWAAGSKGAARNIAARLDARKAGNGGQGAEREKERDRVEERLQRVEDRRRESQARDKLDRATVEQVLDPRTRMILFKLLSRGRLRSIDGCVSTGKEANVYYGTAAPGAIAVAAPVGAVGASGEGGVAGGGAEGESEDVAVKVFKTAILSFKDRERYVAGEFRFRRGGYNRQSNRKMVQQWAEKEYRNLLRLRDAAVPVPTPLLIKPPVLVMSFFGREGWPAPRLKDAAIPPARLAAAYADICVLMRRMFRRARLVHGDLSEYNILYHKRQVVIIDVSQSVEDDHPMALDFLRRDCMNVNEFFARSGVATVLSQRELFEFVIRDDDVPPSYTTVAATPMCPRGDNAGDAGADDAAVSSEAERVAEEEAETARRRDAEDAHTRHLLDEALKTAAARTEDEREEIATDDLVFNQSFIPRTLDDIYTCETDMHRANSSDPAARELYARIAGAAAGGSTAEKHVEVGSTLSPDPAVAAKGTASDGSSETDGDLDNGRVGDGDKADDSDGSSDSGDESDASFDSDKPKMTRDEIKAAKKENKKQVKAEARERRENKTPKHVKKRRDVVAKRRRHVKTKK